MALVLTCWLDQRMLCVSRSSLASIKRSIYQSMVYWSFIPCYLASAALVFSRS